MITRKKILLSIVTVSILALFLVSLPNEGMGKKGSRSRFKHIGPNVITDFSPAPVEWPDIDRTAYVHPQATVLGNVHIGEYVLVSPHASIRGDEGQPIHVGDESNVQDGVVLHALETWEHGEPLEDNLADVGGKQYVVYIGDRVSLAHQAHVHGPAAVMDDTFIGMQCFVFKAIVEEGCVLEPTAKVIGVTIPTGKYVPAGSVITTQADADALPDIYSGYPYEHTNEAVVHVNKELAKGYKKGK